MAKRKPKGRITVDSLTLNQIRGILQKKQQSLGKLESQKLALERKLATIEGRIAKISGSSAGGELRGKLKPARRGRPRKSSTTVTLPALLRQILAHAGKPMKIKEASDEALRCGYRTTSKQFRLLVRQTLNRMEQVKRVGRGLYSLSAAGKRQVARHKGS